MPQFTITNRKGEEFIVLYDEQDQGIIDSFKWYVTGNARGYQIYVSTSIMYGPKNGRKSKAIKMHRMLMNPPADMFVDHIDGNSLNNQRSNLRVVTHRENMQASTKRTLTTTSKYKGVCYSVQNQKVKGKVYSYWKWRVAICCPSGKRIIKYATSEIEAAYLYDQLAIEHHGQFAQLNFPNQSTKP
jgi:hypothetical protein